MVQENARNGYWSPAQVAVVAIVCLALGIGIGYLFRGSAPQAAAAPAAAAAEASPHGDMGGMGQQQQPSPEQIKAMADKAAAPLLEQLKAKPNDAALLAKLGDVYFDTQQFPQAVDYYKKSLAADPNNTDVRTDYATCVWYAGDADASIAEFEKVLKVKPNSPNALFNLGVVRWQGKMDAKGAVQAWEELLRRNPNFEQKERIQELIAKAKQHGAMGAKGKS